MLLLLNVIAGYDEKDSTSENIEKKDYTKFLINDVKDFKVGVPKEFLAEGINPEVKETFVLRSKILKEIRNNVNRIVNCETANQERVTIAASKHRAAIKKIKASGKLEKLPDVLTESVHLKEDDTAANQEEDPNAQQDPNAAGGEEAPAEEAAEEAEAPAAE